MTERDQFGRFVCGNQVARASGRALAARLTVERRRKIARAGWDALVKQRFDGDEEGARHWLGRLGAWVSDAAYRDPCAKFEHPCKCPGGGQMRARTHVPNHTRRSQMH
jgi:hypothetical protein